MQNVVATPRLSKLDDIVLDMMSPAVVHDTVVDIELVDIELLTAEEAAEQAATMPFEKVVSEPYALIVIEHREAPAVVGSVARSVPATIAPARFGLVDPVPWRTDSLRWFVISLVAGVVAVAAMCIAA